MATVYEVITELPAHIVQIGGVEESAYKDVTADVTLTLKDPRICHIDPSAGVLTVTLPESPYRSYTLTAQNVTSSGNAMTLDGNGKNINGNPTLTFSGPYAGRTVQYDSTTDAYILIRSVG